MAGFLVIKGVQLGHGFKRPFQYLGPLAKHSNPPHPQKLACRIRRAKLHIGVLHNLGIGLLLLSRAEIQLSFKGHIKPKRAVLQRKVERLENTGESAICGTNGQTTATGAKEDTIILQIKLDFNFHKIMI